MALLGEDGRGYELARKLDSCGVWRTWLGEPTYANFAPFLSSPSTWESFITSTTHIPLQLRVRALLFDKAATSSSLFLNPNPNPNPNPSLLRLNPSYLQLHADDIYFTLDTDSKNQSKPASANGSRFLESELPESWYNQVIDKYKANKNLLPGESRSPAEMASYLAYATNHKKRRVAFKEDANSVTDRALQPNGGGHLGVDDDSVVFPEIVYAFNCVPDSALSLSDRVESSSNNQKVKVLSVLDTLPPIATSRSSGMIERLGVRPEHVNVEHGGGSFRGKSGAEGNGKVIGPEQAAKSSQKAVARILLGVGFEGAMEGSVEDFSQVLAERICKIGTNLKVLADSYKKQCSAIELLKMLLKTLGFSNFAPLVDVVKDGSKNIVQQIQQQPVHGMQQQMQQQQQQGSHRLPQQVQMQRQMHPQMQQMIHSQNMAFQQQQQLERMRRRAAAAAAAAAAATPRPAMDIDKERPLVQVKIENQDLPIDGNAFTSRHPQMQFRQQQQQMAAMSNFHSQSGTQFRQMSSLQIPSMQSQNISMVRAPPVKVEGFSELMGGDSTSKHDLEENRLTSPSGK